MLAIMNIDGIVEASVGGLSDAARMSMDDVRDSLEKLKSPDPDSRTKEDEGRRVREVDGGWFIINHEKFRKKARSRAAYHRNYRKIKTFEKTTGITKQQFLDTAATVGITPEQAENCFLWTVGRIKGGLEGLNDPASWITYWRNNQHKFGGERKETIEEQIERIRKENENGSE
jgi:hypothetical protein